MAEFLGALTRRDFFSKAAWQLIALGTLGVVAAYITGNLAGDGVEEIGSLKTALEAHSDAAFWTLIVMCITAPLRILMAFRGWIKGWLRWGVVVMSFIGVLAVARTGYLGGELVFKHAAGVEINLGIQLPGSGSESGK